jgi:hypothetical protein
MVPPFFQAKQPKAVGRKLWPLPSNYFRPDRPGARSSRGREKEEKRRGTGIERKREIDGGLGVFNHGPATPL